RVAQGLVGGAQPQEHVLALGAQVLESGVQRSVGVEPPSQLEVRLLHLVLVGLALDAQQLEVVAALQAREGVEYLRAARLQGQPSLLASRLLLESASRLFLERSRGLALAGGGDSARPRRGGAGRGRSGRSGRRTGRIGGRGLARGASAPGGRA